MNKWLLMIEKNGSLVCSGISCVSFEQAVDHCERNFFEGYIVEIKEEVRVDKKVVFKKVEQK